MKKIEHPIVLVGMTASGKSRIGQGLARALDRPFMDTDTLIEAEAGGTIAEIFNLQGEDGFRDREEAMIRKVLGDHPAPCVISTGGGAILRAANADLIFGDTFSIWTQASIPVILERTARRTDRPLLQNSDPEAVLRAMAEKRYPIYSRATMTINTDSGDARALVAEIIERMGI